MLYGCQSLVTECSFVPLTASRDSSHTACAPDYGASLLQEIRVKGQYIHHKELRVSAVEACCCCCSRV